MNPEYRALLNAARAQAQDRATREQQVMIIYEDTNYSRMFVRPHDDMAPRCTVMIEAVAPEKDTKSMTFYKPVTLDPTPGPWEYRSGCVYAGDIRLALMDRAEVSTVPTERDANARLMAKAPELRTALRELIQGQKPGTCANAVALLNLIDRENQ